MKCPVCQGELTLLPAMDRMACQQDDHIYLRKTMNGSLTESYLYRGYRVHTSPEHPKLHLPMTSFYSGQDVIHETPVVYEVAKYFSLAQIDEMINKLNNQQLN